MEGWGVLAELSAEKDVGKGTVCCNLDKVVTKGMEWGDKVWVILVEFVVLGDVYQEVAFNVLVLGGPDLFTTFVDDSILVWVVMIHPNFSHPFPSPLQPHLLQHMHQHQHQPYSQFQSSQ